MKAHVDYASSNDINEFEEIEFNTLEELLEWKENINQDIVIWKKRFSSDKNCDFRITIYDSPME